MARHRGLAMAAAAPHDLAIVPGKPGGFHHAAFVVDSADALFRAADILTMHKARIDYGPGRHGITRGTTLYFFDPPATASRRSAGTRRIRWMGTPAPSGGPGPDRAAVFYYSQELERDVLERLHVGPCRARRVRRGLLHDHARGRVDAPSYVARGERAGRYPPLRGERHVRLPRWRLWHVQDASGLRPDRARALLRRRSFREGEAHAGGSCLVRLAPSAISPSSCRPRTSTVCCDRGTQRSRISRGER
jgi:hypothetical protein